MREPAVPGSAAAPDAIATRELTRTFGAFVAVDRVTLSVRPGEIFGLLGPNGAGKTTLLRMLVGLLLPSTGEASVAGFDVSTQTAAIKRHIGYMAQLFCLYDELTVAENLTFFGGLHGLDGERLRTRRAWAVAMAGLTGEERRFTGELALGVKQRLALASAVLHDPPVLFLDEPTSGVDPASRRAFWSVLEEMTAAGKTIVVSTHHVEEAEYCDRVALMRGGVVIALDAPAALRRALAGHIVELEADEALQALAVAERAPGVSDATLFGRRLHLAVDDPVRAIETLPAWFARAGVTVHRLAPVAPTLEDAVMALIRRDAAPRP